MQRSRFLKVLKWLAQVVFTVLLLIYSLKKVELDELMTVVDGLIIWIIIPVILIMFLDMFINSYRISSLYNYFDLPTNTLKICLVKFQGFFFSLLFPLMGDAYKVQTFKNIYGAGYMKNSLVVFLDRLIYTTALTLLLIPVWFFNFVKVPDIFKFSLLGLLVLELMIFYIISRPSTVIMLVRTFNNVSKKSLKVPTYNISAIKFFNEILVNTVIAIFRHIIIAFMYLLIGYSVIHEVNFNIFLFMVAVFAIMISRVLPVSVGGIGLREYIAVNTFPFIGISSESAFTIAFLVSVLMILQGLLGGISYLFNRIKYSMKPETV